jgi:hypothetical protein
MTGLRRMLSGALLAGISALLLLAGCTSFAETVADRSSADRSLCPAERAAPDPDRPRMALDFRLADDRRTVTGTETVVFTPDLATDRLVFRLVANGPDSAQSGNRLTSRTCAATTSPAAATRRPGPPIPGGCTWWPWTGGSSRGSRPR